MSDDNKDNPTRLPIRLIPVRSNPGGRLAPVVSIRAWINLKKDKANTAKNSQPADEDLDWRFKKILDVIEELNVQVNHLEKRQARLLDILRQHLDDNDRHRG